MNYHSYSAELCDGIIQVQGAQFHVHKKVLLKLSSYFRALFSRWHNPSQFMYNIPGVAPNIMKSILQYAYSKRIRITRGNVLDLFIAADYLLIGSIAGLCSRFLQKQLCPQNFVEIRRYANSLSLHKLRDRPFRMSNLILPSCHGFPKAFLQVHAIMIAVDECLCRRCRKSKTQSATSSPNQTMPAQTKT